MSFPYLSYDVHMSLLYVYFDMFVGLLNIISMSFPYLSYDVHLSLWYTHVSFVRLILTYLRSYLTYLRGHICMKSRAIFMTSYLTYLRDATSLGCFRSRANCSTCARPHCGTHATTSNSQVDTFLFWETFFGILHQSLLVDMYVCFPPFLPRYILPAQKQTN